jgi:hypothetical protein
VIVDDSINWSACLLLIGDELLLRKFSVSNSALQWRMKIMVEEIKDKNRESG